ncbi:hypothetical protein AB0D34_13250 [Streptomyces sp. NPDC048420]|uniref:hypothetical protein n=1 Tax=Streptomyces sp. NPDC048420 TaxID=3155755 RepID=UPI0034155A93
MTANSPVELRLPSTGLTAKERKALQPVEWYSFTRFFVEGFSLLGLVIMLATGLLRQIPELAREWRKARRALRHSPAEDQDDSEPS